MNEHLDLSGMDPAAAWEYVTAVITAYKQAQQRIAKLEEEKGIWESRISLAMERGAEDLRAEAEKKRGEVETALLSGFAEAAELGREVDILKVQLASLKRESEKSVDADLLLAQLSLAVGDAKPDDRAFREMEAERLLDELKKKLTEGEQ